MSLTEQHIFLNVACVALYSHLIKGFENYTIQAKTGLSGFQMSVVQQMVSNRHSTI